MPQWMNAGLVLLLTLLSGLLDARGFVYASRAWPNGRFDASLGLSSIVAFSAGIGCYVVAVKYMQQLGIGAVALQSGLWFVVTAVGISLMDGRIADWSRAQQLVALLVAIGLGWLIATTTGSEPH